MSDGTIKDIAFFAISTVAAGWASWMSYKVAQVAKVANTTHAIVNFGSLLLARTHEITARRLAEETKDPTDIANAVAAKKLLEESELKQDQITARK